MANRQRDAGLETQWRERVERHAASGLGVRAFCQREGISESNFHARRRELRSRDGELEKFHEQPRPTFVPAVITSEQRHDVAVLLTLALDGTLQVSVSVERLVDLVVALRQRGVR
jgi:hypothetical protein